MTVTGIVLAGGASSRFGGDKLTALVDGSPLLHRPVRAVAAVARDVVIVLPPATAQPDLPAELGERIRVAHDRVAYLGPLSGLAAGLAAMGHDPDGLAIVVGGDMPDLVPAVLRALVDALVADPAMAAVTLAADPPATLPMAIRPSIALSAVHELLKADRRSLRGLLAAIPSTLLPGTFWRELDPAGVTLRDVDLPADLDRA